AIRRRARHDPRCARRAPTADRRRCRDRASRTARRARRRLIAGVSPWHTARLSYTVASGRTPGRLGSVTRGAYRSDGAPRRHLPEPPRRSVFSSRSRAHAPRMRNLTVIAIVMVMSLAHASRAATLEDILAKNLAARGGEAKLREIKTLRFTGRVMFGNR